MKGTDSHDTSNKARRPESPLATPYYPRSLVELQGTTYWLVPGKPDRGKRLAVCGDTRGLEGEPAPDCSAVLLCPLTASNAGALRQRLPWLRPQALGLRGAFGFGDRLGLATPGHVRAARRFGLAPVFAQQSVRENARTGRTPLKVMDDAMWGLLQEGWSGPWGADADHLKTAEDIDSFVAAGYTFYTMDPGTHVDNAAHSDPLGVLEQKWNALPWSALGESPDGLRRRYLDRRFEFEGISLEFDDVALMRAACKYSRAVLHVSQMYQHLAARMAGQPFDMEVSVDETDTPTRPLEHWFVASELRRMGVRWVSLAPRFVGRFEKAVDYIGDLNELDKDVAQHAAIARALGPYKLCLHSGSDKLSVYPLLSRHCRQMLHVKTAGTSYLQALRVIANVETGLFREILGFARQRYEIDKATYHVSADAMQVPGPEELGDDDLPAILDTFHGREVLHVTFGSVIDRFGHRLHAALEGREEMYYESLESHFAKHLSALAT